MEYNEWIVQGMVELKRGGMLRIEDGHEMRIYVWEGSAWLTQDGDRRDVLIGAGGWFRLDRDGVAVLYALSDCALTLTSPYEERYAAAVQSMQPGARRPHTLYQREPSTAPSIVQRLRAAARRAKDAVFAPSPDVAAPAV